MGTSSVPPLLSVYGIIIVPDKRLNSGPLRLLLVQGPWVWVEVRLRLALVLVVWKWEVNLVRTLGLRGAWVGKVIMWVIITVTG